MRRELILKIDRVDPALGIFSDATERACRYMSIGVKHIKIIPAHRQVNGIINAGWNLIAEIKIRCIYERAILTGEDPDRARSCIEHIEVAVVQCKCSDATPVGIGQSWEVNRLRN